MYSEEFGCRRQAERTPCVLEGQLVSSDNISCQVKCRNISSKGVGIVASMPLPLNSQVKITVDTKKMGLVPFEGEIMWCKKIVNAWWAGISFNKDLPFALESII